MKQGKVYFMGACPGDPALLTLKGKQCLAEADVVVGRGPAGREFLRAMGPGISYVPASGKDNVGQLLADETQKGKVVVSLCGGAEEMEVLRGKGVPFASVPSVEEGVAAAAYAGIPLEGSYAVVEETDVSALHWKQLGGAVGTLLFPMQEDRVAAICESLLRAGKPADADTPVALILHGTTPRQKTFVSTLGNIAEAMQGENFQPPAVLVVGQAVNRREILRWFDNQPLFGKRIIVTRSQAQASPLVEALARKGAESIEIPTIFITEPADHYAEMDLAIFKLPSYRWLFFTSRNGVDHFFRRLLSKGRDARALGHAAIAAVGPVTARALESYGVHADVVPEEYKAETLLDMMKGVVLPGDRILIPRSNVARRVLPEGLVALGATVDVVEAYRTGVDTSKQAELLHVLKTGGADMVTFSSSATVHHFMTLIKGHEDLMRGIRTACIGPLTADTLQRYGITADVVSQDYTLDGLVEAMEQWYAENNK